MKTISKNVLLCLTITGTLAIFTTAQASNPYAMTCEQDHFKKHAVNLINHAHGKTGVYRFFWDKWAFYYMHQPVLSPSGTKTTESYIRFFNMSHLVKAAGKSVSVQVAPTSKVKAIDVAICGYDASGASGTYGAIPSNISDLKYVSVNPLVNGDFLHNPGQRSYRMAPADYVVVFLFYNDETTNRAKRDPSFSTLSPFTTKQPYKITVK